MANKHTVFDYTEAQSGRATKLQAAALAQGAAMVADIGRHWSLAAAWRRRARALYLDAMSQRGVEGLQS